ncbi:dUTP diphosphatase [bacterium]|nr:dUTP diphosphatase [bacterium]
MKRDLTIAITRLDETRTSDIPLPMYMSSGSAGMDVFAAVDEELALHPGIAVAVPTGFAIAVPEGYEAQVRSRSSLALKHNIIIPNAPGTIDSDYRGEVKVLMLNVGNEPFVIKRMDRIAQLVIKPVVRADWVLRDELPETKRGSGGFGSTGK